MKCDLAAQLAGAVRGEVRCDEPMARHTSLQVGGPADWFITPRDRADLETVLGILAEQGIPYLVLGGGYNLLVRDGGFRGAILSLACFNRLEVADHGVLSSGAGAINRHVAMVCRDKGLSGLEFLVGIPGTIGGALAMNAGAAGRAIGDRVLTVTTLRNGVLTETPRELLEFAYRRFRLEPGEIILHAEFRLESAPVQEIDALLGDMLAHRRTTQQVGYPNAGSFFRNPAAGPAWRYIDAAGLRGLHHGGAQVSPVHANFLVNRGGATAADFLALAAEIKDRVRRTSGIELEEEVRIVGEDVAPAAASPHD